MQYVTQLQASLRAAAAHGLFSLIILMTGAALMPSVAVAASEETPSPDVLVIDDFEQGLDRWKAAGAGAITVTDDAPQGQHALHWTAPDDGDGHITLRNLSRDEIDFSQYDRLVFRVKVAGKRIWNLNPIVQQHPHAYGYRALYYSIDTMYPFDQWYTFSQDLSRWENAWPDTYDSEKQEFQFEVHQLAGSEATQLFIDDVKLIRNAIGVQPSYPGRWSAREDGSQVTRFDITLRNRAEKPRTVNLDVAPGGTLDRFKLEMPRDTVQLEPGQAQSIPVRMLASSSVVESSRPYYGETARLSFTVEHTPGLVLFTELVAGVRPASPEHPVLLCNRADMRTLRQKWRDPEQREQLDKAIRRVVRNGEQSLDYEPSYPPNAAKGRTKDPVSGGRLEQIDVPNLPFEVYQDPKSGRTYSGPLYDAGMQNYFRRHMHNADHARRLGKAYLVTGREPFARAAADILRAYIDRFEDMPRIPNKQSSPAGSAVSGVTRIGGTFMNQRDWLTDLAVALDCIRPSGVLDDDELSAIAYRVFEPAADQMMDHKVGVMNLQWMIQSASMMAGLAVDHPGLVARAVHSQHGIVRLKKLGFLDDGQWWENPSYQLVAKLTAYPALGVAMHAGIMPYDAQMNRILLAAYDLHGPDGRSPTLGTGGPRHLKHDNTGAHIFAKFISDPRLAWILKHRSISNAPYGLDEFARFRQSTPAVSAEEAVNPIPNKTTHMTDYGGVALRMPDSDRYCYFHYGRELTHGHPNKLSINAYGAGGWYVRNVAGGYGDNFDNFLNTIASSTSVMVDGQNADADTGELLYLGSQPGAEIASARERGAWKDVEHERTVVLTRGPLIVLDRLRADESHTYDWLYHANLTKLQPPNSTPGSWPSESFGDSALYSSLQPRGHIEPGTPIHWTRQDGSGVRIATVAGGELGLFHTDDAAGGDDGMLWRKQGNVVGFACAYLPHAGDEDADVQIRMLDVTDSEGRAVGPTDAQACAVVWSGGRARVLVRYSDADVRVGNLRATGRVTVQVDGK